MAIKPSVSGYKSRLRALKSDEHRDQRPVLNQTRDPQPEQAGAYELTVKDHANTELQWRHR